MFIVYLPNGEVTRSALIPYPSLLIRLVSKLAPLSSLTMTQNTLPQRHYPWGKDFDTTLTNSKESGIGHRNAGGSLWPKVPTGAKR